MKFVEVVEHVDTFDDEDDDVRQKAARLALLLYRSSDLALSRERAHQYQAGGEGLKQPGPKGAD